MDSTEKLIAFLEQLDERPDSELAQILPVPVSIARMAIAAASARVPTDATQLDEWALAAAQFCLGIRGDDAPPVELVGAGVGGANDLVEPASVFVEPGSLQENRS